MVAFLVFFLVMFLYMNQANAEEAAEPEEVVEVILDEDDEGFTDKAKNAFKYLFKGDASAILAEQSEDLEARSEQTKILEEMLDQEREALLTERAALESEKAELGQSMSAFNDLKASLTQCIVSAIEGGDE